MRPIRQLAHALGRVARMDASEVAWRGTTAARILADRARTQIVRPRWERAALLPALRSGVQLGNARGALAARQWPDAHRELAQHFERTPQRFVISPATRAPLVDRIRTHFAASAFEAAARADRLLDGGYDLLGYRGLRFTPSGAQDLERRSLRPDSLPDWHLDPVLNRRPPMMFWSTVPYLESGCGDHKVIWELNRHQHWLTLGRAFWLTGEAKYRARAIVEIASWIDANPPLMGVNWASMLELSLRSISWMWAINLFAADAADDRDPWLVDLLLALDRQLTQVERNLSYYFSPNTHLLGEALALYVCGRTLPELAASPRRETTGRDILIAEIDRQIGADGGHAERSTHYHRYTLDFYLLALIVARNTGDIDAARRFEPVVARLAAAARLLANDEGRMPHIGDDDGGGLLRMTGRATDDLRDSLAIAAALAGRPALQIGDTPEEALWMLGPQSAIRNPRSAISFLPSAALRETGYYVSRSRAGDHLVIDGGPHGYQNGGHAHADALAVTLSVRGVPLLIDPGTGCYTTDPALRDRLRSTALHNTLTLDDRPQSLPDGPFHWSHIANCQVHAWRTSDTFDYFDGTHDGYRPVEHRRRLFALHGDLVVVADLVHHTGASSDHGASVYWHLDPAWTVVMRARGATLTRPGADGAQRRVGLTVPQGFVERFTADPDSGLGWYSPEYGRLEQATTVRVTQSGAVPFWMVTVFDLDPTNPVAAVDWMPVWAEAGATAHATAIRITRATSVDHVLFAEPADTDGEHQFSEAGEKSDRSASGPASAKSGPWRVGEIETDARMLFCRTAADGSINAVAMVDGSALRAGGRRGPHIASSRVTPTFFWTRNQAQRTEDSDPCVASPVS